MVKVEKWAMTVTEQSNPNYTHTTWSDVAKSIGDDSRNTYAVGSFTKEKVATHYKTETTKDKNGKQITKKVADKWGYKYDHPYDLSAHDFRFDIPSNAYVKSIKFEVRMRVDGNVDTVIPKCRFNIYGTKYRNKAEYKYNSKTGFSNGVYFQVGDEKLTKEFQTYSFIMNEDALKEAGISTETFNEDIMGIDLIFNDAEFTKENATGHIYVKWFKCTLWYDVPKLVLSFENPSAILPSSIVDVNVKDNTYVKVSNTGTGTKSDPFTLDVGKDFVLDTKVVNESNANGDSVAIPYSIPFGTEIELNGSHQGTWNNNTNTWTIPQQANLTKRISFKVKPKASGTFCISATLNGKTYDYWYTVNPTKFTDGYNQVRVTPVGEIRQGTVSCIDIDVEGICDYDTFNVSITNSSSTPKSFELSREKCEDIGEILSNTNNSISFKVTPQKRFIASVRCCFIPNANPTINYTINCSYANPHTGSLNVLQPYTYVINSSNVSDEFNHANLRTNTIKIYDHRVTTDINTNATILPCVSDDNDRNMIMSDCSLNMSVWEDLDYIGCIPLEQTHFNPKSTFKDTLLNSTYKNKRYMGKKLATDEDITLNVRLHPKQVTTLQGLIEMDKPIPINANHKCFESDALNHRGWAEIYAVKTEQTGNNPHWYKCDIDVKYLTHNLNTRFKIDKGVKVLDYDVPQLLAETFSSGENLSDDVENAYFLVDTDGTFYYAEDSSQVTYNDYERNNFSIDNGQHIRITSQNPLSHTSNIDFTWSSTLMDEVDENNVSRIVRLIGKNDKRIIFEYEYDDLTINDDEISSDVIYRVLGKDGNYYDYSDDIRFRYNPTDVTNENDAVTVESDDELEVISDGEAHFGTTLHFILKNGKLSIRDEGFNGREVSIDNIDILDTDYYYQVEWVNNNSDSETDSVDCVVDFIVQDTILTSTYAEKFGRLIVSPIPVSDKKNVFTRESEEGTIYYYYDDGEEFTFLCEPYYQYHCGTDLTANGMSVFDLNYGYEIVYIQNGLVRLGFNRLTGNLYLEKYDPISDTYITTYRLHLEKYDDINVNSISDDKIEIQASDSIFTIYRGHPYVKIKHELEDIWIDTVSTKVWAEQVGGNTSNDVPVYWDLMNSDNLLDECVGGNTTLKSSCVEVESEDISRTDTSLSISNVASDVTGDTSTCFTTGAEITFTLSDVQLNGYSDVIDLDDSECSFGTLEWDEDCGTVPKSVGNVVSDKRAIQTDDTTSVYAKVMNACGKGVANQTVRFYEVFTPSIRLSGQKSIMQSTDTNNLSAQIYDLVDGSKVPLANQDVRFYGISSTTRMFDGTETFTKRYGTANPTYTYTEDNELKFTTAQGSATLLGSDITFEADSWECTFDMKATGSDGGNIGIIPISNDKLDGKGIRFKAQNNSLYAQYNNTNTASSVTNDNIGGYSSYQTIKITASDGTLNVYLDGTLKKTYTSCTWLSEELCLGLGCWVGGNMFYVKNLVFEER